VRFPRPSWLPPDANTIVHEAVEVFSAASTGITLKTSLAENLLTCARCGLLRSVIVNLIDNAAEALETCSLRESRNHPRT